MASRLESICQALQFIEAHLHAHISVADIADHCGYSLFHFIRLFNDFACQTPYDYLIRRRLSEALKDLRDARRSITDLTYDYCFETPESFSRAFKRVFGILPSVYRAGQPFTGCLPIPPRTRRDMEYVQQEGFAPPRLVSIDELALAGLPVNADGPSQPALTVQIQQLNEALLPYGLGNDRCYFSVIIYADDPLTPLHQFCGAVVADTAFAPPLSIQRIPPGRYARLSCADRDRQLALRFLFFTWLPGACMAVSRRFLVEQFQYDQHQALQRTILIPVRFS